MKQLLMSTAVVEGGTGVALMAVPVFVVQLLLGADITGVAVPVGRVTGAALLALGVACWLASSDTDSRAARGLAYAMVVYNIGAVVVLAAAGLQLQTAGVALWPAVGLHAAMAIWCVTIASRRLD